MIKRSSFILLVVAATLAVCAKGADLSASEIATDIFRTCLSKYSVSCVKPKALAWISNAVHQDEIKITEDLTIVRTADEQPIDFNQKRSGNGYVELFDKIDNFLASHSLRVGVPQILRTEEARSFVPESLTADDALVVPLSEGNVAEGRGFVKKVMIPFLLGLKFKTTVLVPIALALIALKTWKAMTLGLLSLVLAGAMVIFKFAKPKIVNYEVVHYPHHIDHHVPHHIDHHGPPPHHHHLIEPGWARQLDGQEQAYEAYL